VNMLLIREQGKAARSRSGGIYRSGQEIERVLLERGWEVVTHHDKVPLTEVPVGTDVVWFYGKYDEVDHAILAAFTAKVPIIVTSSYNNTLNRMRWIIGKWQFWRRVPLLFFGLWSYLPLFDPMMREVNEQMVMLPKTLRQGVKSRPFRRRKGFAIGDMVKLQMEWLTAGMDIERTVALLREAWPDEPVISFEQHNHGWDPIPGVELVPYQKDLLGWLSGRKLFISLVVGETYAMVPMEAQSVGTPVLYRHQPQSLSQTIGQTGLPFRDDDDLLAGVDFLLRSPGAWKAYSDSGLHNSNAHQHYAVGMDFALRSVIRRSKP